MADDFTEAVEDGLKLAKRVCYIKDRHAAPKPIEVERARGSLHPTAPMVYAVIYDPAIVDNPDLASYQPHVHGRMDPPALIPMQMNEVGLEVECCLDTAVVVMKGKWRLHCVMGSQSCGCRLVVPMGEQGSVLGVEASVSKQSYFTQVVQVENENADNPKEEIGGYLKPQTFSVIIPQVTGGSVLSLKVSWVQKLSYKDGEFSLQVPFSFPEFVNPFGKVMAKRERIKLTLNFDPGKEVLCQATSHALKEIKRQPGSLVFSYEADVLTWSAVDLHFTYSAYCSSLFGSVLLQSPSMHDYDQREMFCLYLFNGSNKQRKVFRNEVIFLLDTSESMRGRTLESTTSVLSSAISKLSPHDSFNIISFNDEICTFSSSLELATSQTVKNATQWMTKNCVAGGGTNIMQPLNEALGMLLRAKDSVPHIILITDGSVEDERNICSLMKTQVTNQGPVTPRISTFGLGLYCNHYFLRMLATICRGQYDAAFDTGSVEGRLEGLIDRVLSAEVINLSIEIPDDMVEVHPFPIPDLLHGSPLIVSGRCQEDFPDSIKVGGILADMTNFTINLKVQRTRDFPLDKVFTRQLINQMTAQAWFSDDKQLEEKIIKLSKQHNISCEYCQMRLHKKEDKEPTSAQKGKKTKLLKHASSKEDKLLVVGGMNIGFGNIEATTQNFPTGFADVKLPEPAAIFMKAAGCCRRLIDCCCCMCCIRACSRMNDQCMTAMVQLCGALACLACFECCSELCCDNN